MIAAARVGCVGRHESCQQYHVPSACCRNGVPLPWGAADTMCAPWADGYIKESALFETSCPDVYVGFTAVVAPLAAV